jgi:ribosomal-protein-alanine N-acetyltransferase
VCAAMDENSWHRPDQAPGQQDLWEQRHVGGLDMGWSGWAVTNGPVVIRSAKEQDLDSLHVLDKEVFGILAYPFFTLRQLLDLHARHCLLADDGTGLVGYCLGAVAAAPRIGWLLGLGVTPKLRGGGYGRDLARETLRRIREDGARRVQLAVEPNNDPAIHLYESLGFRVIEYRADYYGPRADRLIMSAPGSG